MIGVFKDPKVLSSTYLQEGKSRDSIDYLELLIGSVSKFSENTAFFFLLFVLRVILDPELSHELLPTYMEAHNGNDIFLNNHRVGEDYDKY